jgi:hypothetical protein
VFPEDVDQAIPAREARGVEDVRVAILEVFVDEGPRLQAQRGEVEAGDDRRRERGREDPARVLDVAEGVLDEAVVSAHGATVVQAAAAGPFRGDGGWSRRGR